LIDQIEAYYRRLGCYPQSVHADKIYRTRDNLRFCKQHGIRLSCPPLGRPPAQTEKQQEIEQQARRDELDRIPIEGKFEQGKPRFSLARIMCKLYMTSEVDILVALVVMNLKKWLKDQFFAPFFVFISAACAAIRCLSPSEGRSAAVWCRSGSAFLVLKYL